MVDDNETPSAQKKNILSQPAVEVHAAATAGDIEPAGPAFDLGDALNRVLGDRDFLTELVGVYLIEISKLLASLELLVEQRDVKAAGGVAHTIKGAVANFCARSMYEAAWQLEQIGHRGSADDIPAAYQILVRESQRLNQALRSEFALPESNPRI